MSRRCKATHVVQCDHREGHEHYHDNYPGFNLGYSWKDDDPQPRIEITDDMVERGMRGVGNAFDWAAVTEVTNLVLIRAILDAALNGDKP